MKNGLKLTLNYIRLFKFIAIALFVMASIFLPHISNFNTAEITSSNINLAQEGDICSVQVRAVTNGQVSSLGGSVQVDDALIGDTSFKSVYYNTEVQIKALIKDTGFIFEGWQDSLSGGNLISSSNNYTFFIAEDLVVYYAIFSSPEHNLSVESYLDGAYSLNSGVVKINNSQNADSFDFANVLQNNLVNVIAEDKYAFRF